MDFVTFCVIILCRQLFTKYSCCVILLPRQLYRVFYYYVNLEWRWRIERLWYLFITGVWPKA